MALLRLLREGRGYSLYVLFLLLLANLLNQLDRYTLPIVTRQMAQDIHYGDMSCMTNGSTDDSKSHCTVAASQQKCEKILGDNATTCEWNYNGQGFEYQLLAGPIFILIYTFTGIFLGIAADYYNRKNMLVVCLLVWSLTTLITGFVASYWQLAILRFTLGIGEAGCTPFSASLIANYFSEGLIGSALGFYNWGIYIGYSLSFAIGNLITQANILCWGWRFVFIICGIPGIVLAVVIFFSVKEPPRLSSSETEGDKDIKKLLLSQKKLSFCQKMKILIKPFGRPSLLLLCAAGSIRNAGGYVWAYNTQPYFESIGQSKEQIATFMSWIPLVGGSLGVVVGGYISDKLVRNRGLYARVIVLVASQLLAAPFAAGALFLPVPYCYISLIPSNIIGEMWVGVTLAVAIELVPAALTTSAVAFYMFIITNIGGNIPLLVPPLQMAFHNSGMSNADSLRSALYILFPGLYVASALLFLLTMFVIKRDAARTTEAEYTTMVNEEDDEDDEKHPLVDDQKVNI